MRPWLEIIINRISSIGIADSDSAYDQLKYKVFNQGVFAIVIALVIMIVSDLISKNETILYTVLLLFFMLVLIGLIYLNKHNLVVFLFSTIFPALLLIISIFYGEEMNLNYVYFAFIVVAILSFDQTWVKIILATFILILQGVGIYFNRFYGSIIEKDIPILDGILILILPTFGISLLILSQVSTIKKLYDQQKDANAKLEQQNRSLTTLVQQNEAKNKLLAIIGHDLKSPASSFLNLTQKIAYLIKTEQPQQIEKMAVSFEMAGTKLFYTVNNLLSWVTAQMDDISVVRNEFKLGCLVNEVLESLEFQKQIKKVNIVLGFDATYTLTTDWNILKIILLNLLSNAIKFSEPGGEVRISISEKENYSVVEVSDVGPGIKPEVIKKIKNQEIVSSLGTKQEEGHGIGLKICFSIIQYIEGKLEIESILGKGTTMKVFLPKTVTF